MPPTVSHWDSFFFRWIFYFQTISQFFFFFLVWLLFFSKFAVFHFVLEKQDRENGQKEDGKQYCSSPFAYRIKSKALSSSLSVFHTCRPWLTSEKPDWASPITQWVKNSPAMQETQEMTVWSWVRKITWRRAWQPTPLFLPGEFHGQRSLAVGL